MKVIEHTKSDAANFNPFADCAEPSRKKCSEIDFLVTIISKNPKLLFDLDDSDSMNTELHTKLLGKMGMNYPFYIIKNHFFQNRQFVKECFRVLNNEPVILIDIVIKSGLNEPELNQLLEGKNFESSFKIIDNYLLEKHLNLSLPNKSAVTKRNKI